MDKDREQRPEQLTQGDGVTQDVSEHAILEPKKADTTPSELMPGAGKRLKQIARDEGRTGQSSLSFQGCSQRRRTLPRLRLRQRHRAGPDIKPRHLFLPRMPAS